MQIIYDMHMLRTLQVTGINQSINTHLRMNKISIIETCLTLVEIFSSVWPMEIFILYTTLYFTKKKMINVAQCVYICNMESNEYVIFIHVCVKIVISLHITLALRAIPDVTY